MRHVQFFHLSTGYIPGSIPPEFKDENKKLIPVCGSDGHFYPDGRFSLSRVKDLAAKECKQRGFLAFQVERGASILNSKPITPIIPV